MTDKAIPEAWIEQRGSLRPVGGASRVFCTLKAVNDRGVVVGESGRNEEEITAFYPWNTVVSIKVGEPEPQRGEPLTGNIRIPGN